jgi:hypothetical protein
MPGSLGVEAVLQAMSAYARAHSGAHHPAQSRARQVINQTFEWKYRGQVTRADRQLSLEVHLSRILDEEGGMTLIGDASVWKDGLRIYEVQDVALRVISL